MTHCLGYKRGGQTPIKKLKNPPSLKSLNPMMNDIALFSLDSPIKQE
jgi:hypothetical protein